MTNKQFALDANVLIYLEGSDVVKRSIDSLIVALALKSEQLDDITLVPMGAARLRISAFPYTDK